MPSRFVRAVCLAILFAPPTRAADEDLRERQTIAITDENDWWGAWSDKYYTNGARIAWTSPDWFYEPGAESTKRMTISLTQEIYTPKDIASPVPSTGDHPYAGMSYFGFGWSRERDGVLDSAELDLGVAGPASLAKETQRSWHIFLKDAIPRGWDEQFDNDPILNLKLERRAIFLLAGERTGMSWDVVPRVACIVGTMRTEASFGARFRFGRAVPEDFGSAPIRQSAAYIAPRDPRANDALYGFIDFQGECVARDYALDGPMGGEPRPGGSRPFVAQISAGISVEISGFRVSLMQALRTEEFKGQDHAFAFGGITGSLNF